MTDKRTQDAIAAMRAAQANGWTTQPGNTLLRSTTHETPANIPTGWWSLPTYDALEWVSFVVVDGRVRSAVHAVSRTPWTGRTDQKVSIKRALEILAGETE